MTHDREAWRTYAAAALGPLITHYPDDMDQCCQDAADCADVMLKLELDSFSLPPGAPQIAARPEAAPQPPRH